MFSAVAYLEFRLVGEVGGGGVFIQNSPTRLELLGSHSYESRHFKVTITRYKKKKTLPK